MTDIAALNMLMSTHVDFPPRERPSDVRKKDFDSLWAEARTQVANVLEPHLGKYLYWRLIPSGIKSGLVWKLPDERHLYLCGETNTLRIAE